MTTQQNTEPAATQAEGTSRDEVVRRAYSKAGTTLREKYREEFNGLVKKYAEDEGVDWSPKKTKEEKAQEEFARLLEEYPHLADALPQS